MFHSLEAYIAGWGGPLFTLWKMHVLVWCGAGQLTVHFHAMNNGMEALCSCQGGAVLLATTHIHDMKMAGARIFISCKMPALVWGVAGLLATHFHEMKNDRGGSSFSFHGKVYTHWVQGRVVVRTLLCSCLFPWTGPWFTLKGTG